MQNQLRGYHVLAIISAFFMVMFAVNGVFIWRAVTTFPGEQVEKSYLQGIDYNSTIARREAQEALGWVAEIGVDATQDDQLLVRMTDRSGSPLGDLDIRVREHRFGEAADVAYSLRSVEPGAYGALLPEAAGGRTEFVVDVRRRGEDEIIFTARKTLVLS